MVKTIKAKYPGKCSATGARIRPGDMIKFDTRTRTSTRVDNPAADSRYIGDSRYTSNYFRLSSGAEIYVNKGGRCIDAPCCGCCSN